MNRKLTPLLALALGCLTSTTALAIEPVDGVYQIGSAQDWAEFCALHNDGDNQRLNAVLTDDVTVEGNTMIGINGSGKPFRGTFDGQGHTLTISYQLDEERVAPFRRINGATIKNLIVEGTIDTSAKLAAGVVGGLWQSGSTIQNCVSYVTITDTNSGDATHGGICGSFEDVNGPNTIENCAFFGVINAPNREGCGGIVGWTNNNANNNIIRNCLVSAYGFNVLRLSNNDIICRNNGNVENCYYIGSLDGFKNEKKATQATDEQAKSGQLCFLLNGSQSSNPAWFQTIGVDDMPSPLGEGVVYANGSLKCDGTPKDDVTFSNIQSEPTRDDHQWSDWGFCSVCDAQQPDFLEADAEGFFNIATKQQYNWLAVYINNGHADANFRLTQDLDLADYAFLPIGSDAVRYRGTFDGQGFRVKNMKIEGTTKEQGFFSVCSTAAIKNLILDASCVINSGNCSAALVGCCNGDGVLSIENVGVECNVKGTGANAAAFVGCNYGRIAIQIKNCYNTGNVSAERESAIFSGWFGNNGNARVENSWSTGKVTGLDGQNSLGRGIGANQFVNTYDLNSENNGIDATKLADYDESWLTSGRLTFLLNGNKSTDVAWYQTIGTDPHPMLFGSTDVVYANGELLCDGITPKEGSVLTFSNTESSTVDPHQFNDWGFCSECDALQPDFMTANADGAFELTDVKQVNWFSHYADKIDPSANALLMNDIDMFDVVGFAGIASPDHPYTGTFDGQGHKLSNLTIDEADEAGCTGFVRAATAGAVIRNFTIDESCFISGHHYVGAFVGHVSGNGTVLLEQLGNEGQVIAWEQNAGGILGCNTSGELKLTLTNCYNAGPITAAREAGGISGWLGNDAVVTNCYNMATVNGDGSESFARGNNIQPTNCFDPVSNWPAMPVSPIEDFTNGTVYAALSAAAPGVWFLSAEEGGHPVLYNTGFPAVEVNADVNQDGEVGIGDIIAVTNFMAGNYGDEDPETFRARADVNGDGEVGIGDIIAITNIMATSEPVVTEEPAE